MLTKVFHAPTPHAIYMSKTEISYWHTFTFDLIKPDRALKVSGFNPFAGPLCTKYAKSPMQRRNIC